MFFSNHIESNTFLSYSNSHKEKKMTQHPKKVNGMSKTYETIPFD